MSLKRQQYRRGLNHQSKPTWSTFYAIGRELNERLPKNLPLEQCGRALGLTKQNAYTFSVVTLGKIAWRLRNQVGE